MSSFQARLKQAMKEAGINQTTLANKLGACKSSISQYLSGAAFPSKIRLARIADILNVDERWLQGYDPPKEPTAEPMPLPRKITTKQAAQCLHKRDEYIRNGLRQGILNFGSAVPGSGKRINYQIAPEKFRDYVGVETFNQFFGL